MRNYAKAVVQRHSKEQIVNTLKAPPTEGGWAATQIDFKQHYDDAISDFVPKVPLPHHNKAARADLFHITRWIKKAPNRKFTQEGDIPNQIPRLLFSNRN